MIFSPFFRTLLIPKGLNHGCLFSLIPKSMISWPTSSLLIECTQYTLTTWTECSTLSPGVAMALVYFVAIWFKPPTIVQWFFPFFQLTVWGDVFIASTDGFKLGLMPKLPKDVTIQSTSVLAPILPLHAILSLPPILPLTTKCDFKWSQVVSHLCFMF